MVVPARVTTERRFCGLLVALIISLVLFALIKYRFPFK